MLCESRNVMDSNSFLKRDRTSNPLLQTQRGRLQQKRSNISEQISKELRLRAGAENLLRAANNKKLREQVTLELQFVNSNLRYLQDELNEVNTAIEVYQCDGVDDQMPIIPLGLKITTMMDLTESMSDFILEHYSEDPKKYRSSILKLNEMRKEVVNPSRDENGIRALIEYYSQMNYCLEKRFFAAERNLGIFFQWYDTFAGTPAIQKSIAFEKASVLFNLAALYTQISAKQNRNLTEGAELAIESLRKAAGALQYISENFSYSPCMDMQNYTLDVLMNLMIAQAQECTFSRLLCRKDSNLSLKFTFAIAEEAAQVSKLFADLLEKIDSTPIKECLPISWRELIEIKAKFYEGLSHYLTALGVLSVRHSYNLEVRTIFKSHFDCGRRSSVIQLPPEPPESNAEQRLLAFIQLKEANSLFEECQQMQAVSKQLMRLESLYKCLRKAISRVNKCIAEVEGREKLVEIFESAPICARTDCPAQPIIPDFKRSKVVDLFHDLGPIGIFNAKAQWTPARRISLYRSPGLGFSIKGDSPVIVSALESGGAAERTGARVGDYIVGVNDIDVKWASHESVVDLIKNTGERLSLWLVTPRPTSTQLSSGYSSSSVSSGTLPIDYRSRKPLPLLHRELASTNFGTLKVEKKKHSTSTWNLKSLLFAKKKFKSMPDLNQSSLYMKY